MFTGIVKSIGTVVSVKNEGSTISMTFRSTISKFLSVDESLAHNGVCLTITHRSKTTHSVNIIKETLKKTNLGDLKIGDKVNLERALSLNTLLSGHIVQGHVDLVGKIKAKQNLKGSYEFTIQIKSRFSYLVIPQGSICINGVSLTIADIDKKCVKVCIIPYTYKNTTFNLLKVGDLVNIEFDIIGKYVLNLTRKLKLR